MNIDNPYDAFCFDEAVGEFGAIVSNELGKVDGKNSKAIAAKQEMVLKSLLGDTKQQFATPVATTTDPAALKALADKD